MKIILIIAINLCELGFTLVEQIWNVPNIELTQSILNKENIDQNHEQQHENQNANS
ncbi:hypothetical protein ACYSNM_03885 [Myroides sp. LJL116]